MKIFLIAIRSYVLWDLELGVGGADSKKKTRNQELLLGVSFLSLLSFIELMNVCRVITGITRISLIKYTKR